MGAFPFRFKATTTVKHLLRANGPPYSAANKLKVVSTQFIITWDSQGIIEIHKLLAEGKQGECMLVEIMEENYLAFLKV